MELKRCPFCGKNLALIGTIADLCTDDNAEYNKSHYIVCCDFVRGGCGATIGWQYTTEEDAADAWNRRANDATD